MILRAKETDVPELLRIWEESVRETHDFLLPEDFVEIRSKMPDYLSAVDLYKYEDDGKTKGFLGVSGEKVEMLFVGERGKGIGTELLSHAVRSLGCTAVDVNTQNRSALQFYQKCGFTISAELPTDKEGRPYPITCLTLEK